MTIYAVGDLHGNLSQFQRVLRLIEADGGPDAQVVWLGDYADRGADVRALIDALIEGRAAGRPWRFVKGNHDRMFRRFVAGETENDLAMVSGASWLNGPVGGLTTLASYGLVPETAPVLERGADGLQKLVRFEMDGQVLDAVGLAEIARERIPAEHIAFLDALELFVETEDLILVHAGLRPGVPLDRQVEDDLVWIRAPFLEDSTDHGKLVVHGHTPVDVPVHMGNRVALDTGAGYGRRRRRRYSRGAMPSC